MLVSLFAQWRITGMTHVMYCLGPPEVMVWPLPAIELSDGILLWAPMLAMLDVDGLRDWWPPL